MRSLLYNSLVLAAGLGMSAASHAAPWVDSSDIYLRADIQALADARVITVPVNTYPLMWAGIGADLAKVEPATLTPALTDAFSRVNFYYRQAIENRGNAVIKATAATDAARFQHFGSDYREKGQLSASYEYVGERFAFKAAGTGAYDAQDDESARLDDSYMALMLGNWIVTAGAVQQWWGPGFDSALHKSNNARPMPSVMLSRNNAAGFETPWLSWIGPWTLTTGFSWMNDDRAVEDTLLWSMRGSIRPFKQLEIGVSWTTQFCGEGQECGFDTFWNAITGGTECANGEQHCDPSMQSKIGNQIAGFDVRYADTLFNVPVGLYLERTCEDSSGPAPWQIADCAVLVGADTRFNLAQQQYKLFFEYTDTLVACGSDPHVYNCFYEHSTYLSGSRYYKRSLGSTYDSDANVYVLGLVGQFADSHGINAYLRYAQLNKDGKSPSHGWAPQPPKEDLLMLELSYRMPLLKGMMTFGGTASRSEFATYNDNDASLFGSYEYRF
ncbi:capsule assembly Wzi family protein [Shewanella algae]|uniref:capsule assembly Wzi family protein n=2 Tax=Shewanella algae TaxID=38313 RepID=UPI00399A9346